MYCRKCGQEISDRQSFCPYCGADQRKETTSFTTMIDIKERKNNKVKKTRKYVLSYVALSGFIFSFLAVFFDAFVFINLIPFAVFGALFGLISLVLSIIGIKETKHNIKNGSHFAYSGFVLSILALIVLIVVVLITIFYR